VHPAEVTARYRRPLDDLVGEARVPVEEQATTQQVERHEPLTPQEADLIRLLPDPASAGRLRL
jgi:hypothetical protein